MKKADLRTGMRVTAVSGRQYLVFLNSKHEYSDEGDFIVNSKTKNWNYLSYYNDDLLCPYHDDNIVKVEVARHPYYITDVTASDFTVIWERTETKEMTVEEIQQALGYKIKVVESK